MIGRAHNHILLLFAMEAKVTTNILRADWIRAAAPFVLTVAVVGAALAFAFAG
jgi:hypothetical protein